MTSSNPEQARLGGTSMTTTQTPGPRLSSTQPPQTRRTSPGDTIQYNTIQYKIQWSQHYSRYAYNATELATVTLRDVANADYAVQKLANLSTDAASGTQPFFFVMGFHKVRTGDIVMFRSVSSMLPLQPHLPYDAPQEYFDLYDAADMDLPYNPYIPEVSI